MLFLSFIGIDDNCINWNLVAMNSGWEYRSQSGELCSETLLALKIINMKDG